MTFTGQSGESADTLFNGANDTLSSSIQSGDFLLSLQSANNTIFSTATVDTGELGSYSVSTHSPTASPFNESGGSSTCNIHATMRHVDQRQSGSTVCPSGLTTCSSDLSGVLFALFPMMETSTKKTWKQRTMTLLRFRQVRLRMDPVL